MSSIEETLSLSSQEPYKEPHAIELFDEFFESGMAETVSPFLSPTSRKWGKNLSLKASLIAAFSLLFSFIASFIFHKDYLSSLFLLLTYFFAGIPALIGALEDLFSLEINIDILMTLAAFLSVLIGSGHEGGLLLVLFAFSGAMEDAVEAKAKHTLSSLKKLAPTKAFVVQADQTLIERSIKDIDLDTHILIKAGQVVPLDGIIIEGASFVNLVHLTGENLPISKVVGDRVEAGSRNLEGSFILKITEKSSDSTLSKIIKLITEAQEAKPKVQRWLDTITSRYALTIISLSFLFALSFPFIFNIPFLGDEGSIYRALAFLIAASPCALIIAIPIAYLSAVSACARKGILLKGGMTLDALSHCTQIAFDKTGTLTEGQLECIGIDCLGDIEEKLALSIAYGLEKNALHPIATALCKKAEEASILAAKIKDFSFVAGFGLKGFYDSKPVFIGSERYIFSQIEDEETKNTIKSKLAFSYQKGEIVTILLIGQDPILFSFQDKLRPHLKETLRELKELGMKMIMLTGDHEESAKSIAQAIGMDHYLADLKPEDKLKHISLLSKNETLAMVGDGINDAPAIARAHVGISMGKGGSSTAVDASDIVFLQDNIELIAWLVKKSKSTKKIVKQNLTLAIGAILVATLPALLGFVPLWLAVILHEGGTVLVGLNALRLLR